MRTCLLIGLGLAGLGLIIPAEAPAGFGPRQRPRPIYLLLSPLNGDYLYTNNRGEIQSASPTYDYQGVAFYVAPRPRQRLVPLYRFMGQVAEDAFVHRLSISPKAGRRVRMRREQVLGYISRVPRQGLRPLHAWYNPRQGTFFYTTRPADEIAPVPGYRYLKIMGYVIPGKL